MSFKHIFARLQYLPLLPLVLWPAFGCTVHLQNSSQDHLSPQQSQSFVSGSPGEIDTRLTDLFTKRGFPLVDRRPWQNERVLKFKGNRTTSSNVAPPNSDEVLSGGPGTGGTISIGSTFYVILTPHQDGASLRFLGLPTLDGEEICSPAGKPFGPCRDFHSGSIWSGRNLVSGREEAEVIRGVLLEL